MVPLAFGKAKELFSATRFLWVLMCCHLMFLGCAQEGIDESETLAPKDGESVAQGGFLIGVCIQSGINLRRSDAPYEVLSITDGVTYGRVLALDSQTPLRYGVPIEGVGNVTMFMVQIGGQNYFVAEDYTWWASPGVESCVPPRVTT